MLIPEEENSLLLPELSFPNQNICLEEKWLLTLSFPSCWKPTDAGLGCRSCRPGNRARDQVLGEGKSRRADCLSHLPSCFPHELSPGSKVACLLGMSLQDSGVVGCSGVGEEEDGSRRMRHVPLGTSRHSGVLQVGQVL